MLKISFAACPSLSVSIDFGTIRSWNASRSLKSPKNPLKTPFWRSRLSKVIDFGANQEPVYDFLLVINSNLGPISHRLIGWKLQNFPTPSNLAPLLGVTLFEFMEKFYGSWKLDANGEDLVILACTVFDWSTCVTDRWTDKIAMAKMH